MATESSGDPEVDLGFRNPATTNFVPGADRQKELPLSCPEIPCEYPHRHWWSLPIAIVTGLFAIAALTSSAILFNNLEHPRAVKRWKRDVYIPPKPEEGLNPQTTLNFWPDAALDVRVGIEFTSLGNCPAAVKPPLAPGPSLEQPTSLTLAPVPLRPVMDLDSSAVTESGRMVTEKTTRENATQPRNIRIVAEKMRKREIARRLRHRLAKRAAQSAKSFASFWAIWSHHLLGSGLAVPGNTRRLALRRPGKRSKGSPAFPLSWQAVASPPAKRPGLRKVRHHSSVIRRCGDCLRNASQPVRPTGR